MGPRRFRRIRESSEMERSGRNRQKRRRRAMFATSRVQFEATTHAFDTHDRQTGSSVDHFCFAHGRRRVTVSIELLRYANGNGKLIKMHYLHNVRVMCLPVECPKMVRKCLCKDFHYADTDELLPIEIPLSRMQTKGERVEIQKQTGIVVFTQCTLFSFYPPTHPPHRPPQLQPRLVAPSENLPPYSPFNFPCKTLNAISNRSCSSFT